MCDTKGPYGPRAIYQDQANQLLNLVRPVMRAEPLHYFTLRDRELEHLIGSARIIPRSQESAARVPFPPGAIQDLLGRDSPSLSHSEPSPTRANSLPQAKALNRPIQRGQRDIVSISRRSPCHSPPPSSFASSSTQQNVSGLTCVQYESEYK